MKRLAAFIANPPVVDDTKKKKKTAGKK